MLAFAFKVVQFGYLKYDKLFAVQLRLLTQEQLQKSLDDLKRLGQFYPVG